MNRHQYDLTERERERERWRRGSGWGSESARVPVYISIEVIEKNLKKKYIKELKKKKSMYNHSLLSIDVLFRVFSTIYKLFSVFFFF